jgi:2-keto-4-pentenoate hydratase/2-oxohepta-3-ene-1,7-dioic acid hydratase in catechol pathway
MQAMDFRRGLALATCGLGLGLPLCDAARAESLDACLNRQPLTRIARVLDPQGRVVHARVTAQTEGRIERVVPIAEGSAPVAEVFARAALALDEPGFEVNADAVCAVVDLPEAALDAETRVIVSTGLNFAAHAEEAGGGDVFLFPKPAAPPDRATFLEQTAFFLSNDVSDREAIVRNAALSGPGTGFAEAKGQPGFFPAGPWMIRGSELFAAIEHCGGAGLGLTLWVDEEPEPRQDATTERMILQPWELVGRVGSWIDEHGRRTDMPFRRPGDEAPRFYAFAVPEETPRLPAGSIIQTGTPEGVALNAPSPLGVTLRGALHLRGPFAQFLVEEKQRVADGGTKYLGPGSVVRARIDGLGEQHFEIGEAGGRARPHPCQSGTLP